MNSETKNTLSTANNSNADNINLQKKRMRTDSMNDKKDLEEANKAIKDNTENIEHSDLLVTEFKNLNTENIEIDLNLNSISKNVDKKNEINIIPPSSKPECNCVLITNLQRPFSNVALQELLKKNGTIKRFWMDFIKTHCYVEFNKLEEAIETREKLFGEVWPVSNGRKLNVDFATTSDLDYAIENKISLYAKGLDEKKNPVLNNSHLNTINTHLNSNNEKMAIKVVEKDLYKQQQTSDKKVIKDEKFNKNEENNTNTNIEQPKTLEDLFKKTVTKPHLYYLPLSDEQVQEKLKLRKSNVNNVNLVSK